MGYFLIQFILIIEQNVEKGSNTKGLKMLSKLLQPEIKSLIAERKLSTLKEILSDWTPADIADLIVDLSEQEQVIIFRLLSNELAADTFENLEVDTQKGLLKAMAKSEVAAILNEMDPDDRTALLEELPGAAAKQLIQLLSVEERIIARTLLGYPENSVGRLMTPDYIAIKPAWTIEETLKYIRENAEDSETLNIVYVIDDRNKLPDDMNIKEFILASPDKKVTDLMDENTVWVNPKVAKGWDLQNKQEVWLENQDGVISSNSIKVRVTERIRFDSVYMVHGFGHTQDKMTRSYKKGVSDAELITKVLVDPEMGGTGMRGNFVTFLTEEPIRGSE